MTAGILRKIKAIKDFGIFSSYIHAPDLPVFARYNLIYGWNGTGKTTLTRLLRCFETGKVYEDFATGTFTIDCNGSPAQISNGDLTLFSNRLKVFNRDFIEENIDLDAKKGGKAKPVAHVGKANIEKSHKLKELKKEILTAKENRDAIDDRKGIKSRALDKMGSAIAREVKGITQTARNDGYKNYDKGNVKGQYERGEFLAVVLTPEQHDTLKAAINAENKSEINFTPLRLSDLRALDAEIDVILKIQVLATETIERLKDNPTIEAWIRDGMSLHLHKGGIPCEFCGNAVAQQRFNELQKHFSGEREEFLKAVDEKIADLEQQKQSFTTIPLPHATEFFPEFQEEYKTSALAFNETVKGMATFLDKIILALLVKKKNPYGLMSMDESGRAHIDALTMEFRQKQSDLQMLVAKHNKKVIDFDNSIQKDKEKLEHSVLNLRKVEYEAIENEIKALAQGHIEATTKCDALEKEITDIETEIQETRIACEVINANLKDYLGHGEIQFKDFNDGYLIKRNSEVAKNLSEGEKTAIAFVYFIATLKDRFDPTTGVIVIDDPVSSLDANNIHHAFHFMVAHTREAGQLFIFTHNFSFLRKVKQWFSTEERYHQLESGYYQLICALGAAGKRISRITELDPLLRNYDSEYHYLFKLLMDCTANDDMTYEDLYPLVNAGRKVLETFLDFKYPATPGKFGQLKKARVHDTQQPFDMTKGELLYGLLNDGSHAGFDTGGFDTFRNSPEIIKRAIEALLDFIEAVDPIHYRNLCECKGVKARIKAISVTKIMQNAPDISVSVATETTGTTKPKKST